MQLSLLPFHAAAAGKASTRARRRGMLAGALVVAGLLLGGCGSMQPPVRPTVYDFGPAATPQATASPQPPVVLHEIESSMALENNALQYRLGYADAQALRPYAQARWSMPPAQLLRLRLREVLGQSRNVLVPQDAPPGSLPSVRVDLEEFSHWFDSPQASSGWVRVRATLVQPGKPALQTTLVARQTAPSADAPGGARALARATDAIAAQLAQWLRQNLPATP